MAEVRAVGKDGRAEVGRDGFRFRGVDATVMAVGPALRNHGVIVLPKVIDKQYGEFTTRNGSVMHSCIAEVEYTFVGPAGDRLSCSVLGEASDSGDKATPKAMSVAFRTALLQSLCIPTDEPDPDEHVVERAAPQEPANIVAQRTLLAEVKQANPDHGDQWARDCARDIWDNHGQNPKRLPEMLKAAHEVEP